MLLRTYFLLRSGINFDVFLNRRDYSSVLASTVIFDDYKPIKIVPKH